MSGAHGRWGASEPLRRALAFLGRNATVFLIVSLFAGILLPWLSAFVRPFLPISVLAMLALTLARTDLAAVVRHLRRPVLILAAIALVMLASPFAIAGAIEATRSALGIPVSAGFALGLMLYASAPPIASSAAVAGLIGLDVAMSLILLLGATVLAPISIPLITDWLGYETGLTSADLARRLALLIGVSLLSARLLRVVLRKERLTRYKAELDGIIVIFVSLFALAAMDGVMVAFLADPGRVLGLIGLVFAVSLVTMGSMAAVLWFAGGVTALTIGFSGGLRNMALAIASLGPAVPPDTWLYFSIAQFPIYILPHVLRSVAGRVEARAARRSA